MLTIAQTKAKYGNPGDVSNLVTFGIPYPMRLSWDVDTTVQKVTFHKLAAPKLLLVFEDILAEYGYERLKELGIDLFGGTYNNRSKRNGTEPSMHAFGLAIDLDPVRNTLKETKRTARFARVEYKPMIDIFYLRGFVSLGREKNYDWMHFEVAS